MDEMDMTSPEMIAFGLIAQAGEARSKAFEALSLAKQGDFDGADRLIAEADESILSAHHTQTGLLAKEASGDHTEVNVMLVHAQDHLMTGILAKELIAEMIETYRTIAELRSDVQSA